MTGGSNFRLPVEGDHGAGGRDVTVPFFAGLPLALLFTGELEVEEDACLLAKLPLVLEDATDMCLDLSSSLRSTERD